MPSRPSVSPRPPKTVPSRCGRNDRHTPRSRPLPPGSDGGVPTQLACGQRGEPRLRREPATRAYQVLTRTRRATTRRRSPRAIEGTLPMPRGERSSPRPIDAPRHEHPLRRRGARSPWVPKSPRSPGTRGTRLTCSGAVRRPQSGCRAAAVTRKVVPSSQTQRG